MTLDSGNFSDLFGELLKFVFTKSKQKFFEKIHFGKELKEVKHYAIKVVNLNKKNFRWPLLKQKIKNKQSKENYAEHITRNHRIFMYVYIH